MLSALYGLIALLAPPTFAIQDVSIIQPGKSQAITHQTVVLRGDEIVSVGALRTTKVPFDATVIDGKGKFLMPGLWDMHVHLIDDKSLGLFTANGVTGVRVMFGSTLQMAWRNKAESGEIVGPRMVLGSPIVDGPKPVWQGSIAVSNADQAREAVRKIKKDGYDFIKVYSLLSREAYYAIADESKKLGIRFEGHVPHSIGLVEAMNAGQHSAEHMMGIAVECSTRADEYRKQLADAGQEGLSKAAEVSSKISKDITDSYDPKKWDNLLKELARGPMWHTPTLIVLKSVAYLDDPNMQKDPRLKYVPAFLAASWDPQKDFRFKARTAEDWARAKRNFQMMLKNVAAMHKAGVPMLAGTDCLNPFVFAGFSLHDELAMLVDVGMTPTEAIAAATLNPAKYYGMESKSGTVGKGKRADLVLLTANPLDDIHNTTTIAAVFQRGKLFDRKALDQLLKERERPTTKPSDTYFATGICDHAH